jgi:hypothetical protein
MAFNAVAFLEGLFPQPDGTDADSLALPALGFTPPDLPPEWHVDWDERAAILEYDGGHPRERAEALALKEILGLMRRAGVWLGR